VILYLCLEGCYNTAIQQKLKRVESDLQPFKVKVKRNYSFVFFLGFNSGLYYSSDFPFHLKTGEYIWQHREIPKDDPFSFYGEGVVTDRERFTLSQYWIAQLLFYKLYFATGPAGIILLRSSVFSAFVFFLWFVLRKRGMYSALIIATLTAIMFQASKTDRPQFFSFLFTLIIVLLLERFKEKPESSASCSCITDASGPMRLRFVFGIALIIYTFAETSNFCQ
jgi:hypothetical protein